MEKQTPNEELYKKAHAEHMKFREYLLTAPEPAASKLREYFVQEDMLTLIERDIFPEKRVEMLMSLNRPLMLLYDRLLMGTEYLDTLWEKLYQCDDEQTTEQEANPTTESTDNGIVPTM